MYFTYCLWLNLWCRTAILYYIHMYYLLILLFYHKASEIPVVWERPQTRKWYFCYLEILFLYSKKWFDTICYTFTSWITDLLSQEIISIKRWIWWKYYVLVCENGKVRPGETIPRMGKGERREWWRGWI
jgi:hypothetical protein